jgi:predicted amidophosphoribosyltransferase
VWPPRAGEVGATPSLSEVSNLRSIEPPPKAPARAPLAPVETPANSKRLAEHWFEIEQTWLDVVAPALPERMRVERWSPDTAADYCSACALSVRRDELEEDRCAACRSGETKRPPWQRILRLGEYAPPLDQWIREVKFTRWRRLGLDLGRLLGDVLRPEVEAAQNAGSVPPGPPAIVPVPMPGLRRLMRGIDHSMTIARGVAERLGGRAVQPLVRDLRPSQTKVAPSSRAANVANSIHPKRPWRRPRLGDRLVIVVDDVTTTTSTLRGACRGVGECLRDERESAMGGRGNYGCVWAAVVARTPPDSHDFLDGAGE